MDGDADPECGSFREESDEMFTIKIAKNGPYMVEGDERLIGETITEKRVLENVKTQEYQTEKVTALCRCGHSANKPYCDGTHAKIGFDGTTTASRVPYLERAEVESGPTMDLLDDQRCAYARFCHREDGEVWTLTEYSDDPRYRQEAIDGAKACPAGRLTARVDGELLEDHYESEIAVVEDPLEGCSAGLAVRGDFEMIDEHGDPYEKRNRVALCRCGASNNKPFCDAEHVAIGFQDEALDSSEE